LLPSCLQAEVSDLGCQHNTLEQKLRTQTPTCSLNHYHGPCSTSLLLFCLQAEVSGLRCQRDDLEKKLYWAEMSRDQTRAAKEMAAEDALKARCAGLLRACSDQHPGRCIISFDHTIVGVYLSVSSAMYGCVLQALFGPLCCGVRPNPHQQQHVC
jgi:hypothetical protein